MVPPEAYASRWGGFQTRTRVFIKCTLVAYIGRRPRGAGKRQGGAGEPAGVFGAGGVGGGNLDPAPRQGGRPPGAAGPGARAVPGLDGVPGVHRLEGRACQRDRRQVAAGGEVLILTRYFDTSVVVAYYLPEENSAAVQGVYAEADGPKISALVELEFFAAVSLRTRIGDLTRQEAREVSNLFAAHLQDGLYDRHGLSTRHYGLARDFVARFDLPLKPPDALHLALCSAEDITLLTSDRQLARNAEALDGRAELVGR